MADKLEISKIFEELDNLEKQNEISTEEFQRENEELLLSSGELLASIEDDEEQQEQTKASVSEKATNFFSRFHKDKAKETATVNVMFDDTSQQEQAGHVEESLAAPALSEPSEEEEEFNTVHTTERLVGIRRFGERHRNWILASFAAFVVVLVGLAGIFNYYMAYEYSYNGKLLGVVKDKEDVLRITDLVQSALTEEKNLNVVIDKKDDISFKRIPVFGSDTHIDSSEEVLKRMTYVDDINVRAYSISVNGKKTAVVGSKESANNVLSSLKKDYVGEGAVIEDADFLEDVKIEPVNTDLQRLQKEDTAKAALKAGSQVKKSHIVSVDETFADLAKKYDMSEQDLQKLNPTVDPAQLVVGSSIKYVEEEPVVTLKTVEFVTYTEAIKYDVVEKKSNDIYKDEKEVKKKGENGKKQITARIEKTNGKEDAKEIIVEKVEQEPTNEEVVVGIKKRPPTIGDGKFIYPVKNYRLSSPFAWRWGRQHKGIDLALPTGSKVVASDGGTVKFAGYKGSLGYVVMIDHQNGMESWYGHNESVTVKTGEKVYEGKQIAWSGNTGRSTGPHVHFQINIDGEAVDPIPYMIGD